MIRVLAMIIDFGTAAEAEDLSYRLSFSQGSNFTLEVIHVDNGNQVARKLSERQRRRGIGLFRLKENWGYASALNSAIQHRRSGNGKYDAFWFLNSDLKVDDHCLEKLCEVLESRPEIGAIGPIVFLGNSSRVWGARGAILPWLGITRMTAWPKGGELPRWSYIPGCSLLTRAQAYQDVGGMPDRYRLYYEETEYCVRLQKKGWTLWVETGARIFHDVKSFEKKVPARHFAFYFARNNIYFWRENFGIPALLQFPRTLIVVIKELILPLRRAENCHVFWDRLGCALAGLVDGFFFFKRRVTFFETRLFDNGK